MDEELIKHRMTALRGLRQKRQLQDAFRRGRLKRGSLREHFDDELLAAMSMPSPEALLVRLADFSEDEARFLCAEPDTPSKEES